MNTRKSLELLKVLPRNPVEFWDRVNTFVEVKRDQRQNNLAEYRPITWDMALDLLDTHFGGRFKTLADEQQLQDIENEVGTRQVTLMKRAPWTVTTDGDVLLGRLCYMLVRASRPTNLVETGVAYGVTTSFILKALEVNGHGALQSIDLPPLGRNADAFVGALVPESLKSKWILHRGSSKRVLPPILETVGSVEFFLHDSLHTHKTMQREFASVEPYLPPGAVVVADDIQGNSAFDELQSRHRTYVHGAIGESSKEAMLGFAIV